MFALILLTTFVLIRTFRARVRAVRSGAVRMSYFRAYIGAVEMPDDAQRASRHFSNLFEVPVLFYAACLAAMILRFDSAIFLFLAWAYVVARIAHAFVHLGYNNVMHRIYVYFTSWVVLMAMWVMLVLHVSLAG